MKKDMEMANVRVIPNAIEAKTFGKLYDASILPDEVQGYLREKKIDIGYVGRLTKDKGMNLLIDLKIALPEVGVITIGSGPYKKALSDNGVRNYSFMRKEQVACFMQNIDLLVLPATETDPFGLVVLEAIAAKCPTVITDKVGVSDYLVDKKETIVVKCEDFVAKVVDLSRNKATLKKVAMNSEKTLNKFKVSEMLDSYEKLFR
jgi:glycosyltransferase involved in cell wall biosynthesis